MASPEEIYLLDTNILIYAYDEESPHHQKAKNLRDEATQGKIEACLTPQILYEFFAVATDSRRVTNPLSPEEAIKEVEKYYEAVNIEKIYPSGETLKTVVELIKKYKAKRQEIFDTYLVATMLENRIKKIYTEDIEHFKKYKEIKSVNPFR